MGEALSQMLHYSGMSPQRVVVTGIERKVLLAHNPLITPCSATAQEKSPVGHKGVSKGERK